MVITPQAQELVYTVAAGLCVFGLAMYLGSLYNEYLDERLATGVERGREAQSFLFRTLKPIARFFGHVISSALTRLQARAGDSGLAVHLMNLRLGLQRTLISAGAPEGLTADEMLGLIVFSIIVWSGLGVLGWCVIGSSFVILVGASIGLLQPLLWLKGRVERRRMLIRRLLPYSLDLLTLSVEAGLDFTAALARLAPKLGSNPLAYELGDMLRAIRLGRSRSEALREMADRVGMSEVTSFAASLIQADELGADLGPVLRVLAEQMRNDRSSRAEKKAMEAPVKILFPLIVFIFPTVFLIIFGGIGMEYLSRLFRS